MIESEVCSFYDYGSESQNKRKYNQTTPPILSAKDVHLPVSLFAAQKDPLANPKVGRQAKTPYIQVCGMSNLNLNDMGEWIEANWPIFFK